MITANVAACIKGIRLAGEGNAKEAHELMKVCTRDDLAAAVDILEDQALWAGKLMEIGKRHHAHATESMFDLLTRAAAAGDEEAKALIDCGLLEQKRY